MSLNKFIVIRSYRIEAVIVADFIDLLFNPRKLNSDRHLP